MRAMVLAAGLGTRLRPLTYEITKPMVPVLDRPVMEHIVDLLDRHGLHEVIANLHYFPDSIREHFGRAAAVPLRGGTARHGRRGARMRELLRRGRLPDHLRRRPHGHRPDGADRPPPRERGRRDAGGQEGLRHARVRRRAARPQRQDHRLPGEAGARGGALGPRQLRHLRVRPVDLRLLPRAAVRRLGPGRLPGAARERRALPHPRDRRVLERRRVARRSSGRAPSTPSPESCGCRWRERRSRPASPSPARAPCARTPRSTVPPG